MPPRIQQVGDDRTPASFYASLPPLTRLLLTTYLITGMGTLLGVTPLKHMYLDWSLVLRNPFKKVPEVWRLLANFAFIGKPNINFLFQLIWLVKYGGSLEAGDFQHNAADGVFMLLVGMLSTLALDFVVPLFRGFFHGSSLIFMLVYLWSKRNPNAPISLFGMIQLQGLHLPFAFMAVTVLMGGPWQADLLGILAGHIYYFLKDVYPRSSGRNVLRTPTWLARLVARAGIGQVPIQQLNPANPADIRFRAFQGRGRRLGN